MSCELAAPPRAPPPALLPPLAPLAHNRAPPIPAPPPSHPLQVLISRNEIDTYFWLNLLLTLLAWLPGVCHAVWVVLCKQQGERRGGVGGWAGG